MRLMVSGHRNVANTPAVLASFRQLFARWAATTDPSTHQCISGMALGVDMMFAEEALAKGFPLVAAVPDPNQPSTWPWAERKRWEAILENPLTTQVSTWLEPDAPDQYKARLFWRNAWMVRNSDRALVVWDGREHGGTWDVLRTCRRQQHPYLIIDARTGAFIADPLASAPAKG